MDSWWCWTTFVLLKLINMLSSVLQEGTVQCLWVIYAGGVECALLPDIQASCVYKCFIVWLSCCEGRVTVTGSHLCSPLLHLLLHVVVS